MLIFTFDQFVKPPDIFEILKVSKVVREIEALRNLSISKYLMPRPSIGAK